MSTKVIAMRTVVISLLFTAVAFAQTDAKPATNADKVLNDTLAAWEGRMTKLEGLSVKVKVTEVEDGDKAVYTGDLAFMRPNFARLMLKLEADPKNARKWRNYVADGTDLWELNHHTKTAHSYGLGRGVLDGMVGLVTGKKANDVRDRYELSLDLSDPKFNEYYARLTIKPKTDADKQDFKKAELVLWRSQNPKYAGNYMLPARLWFQRTNGSQVTWEFTDLEERKFAKEDFALPKLSADWTIERAKAAPTSRSK